MLVGHVDDCIGAADTKPCFQRFIKRFKYPLSSCGALSFVLKIKVRKAHNCVFLSQTSYIDSMAAKFGLADANPKFTPVEPGLKLSKTQQPEVGSAEHELMAKTPYRQLLGALLYASENRPDIKGPLSVLARFGHNPASVHWKALKRVLAYLKATRTRELCIGRGIKESHRPMVEIHVDADHGGCPDSKRSTSGVWTSMRGSTIESVSKRQGSVSNSTAASELKAMLKAVHKAVVLHIMFDEIGISIGPILVHSDSQVAISMIERGHLSTATRHLAHVFAEVLEAVKNKIVVFRHVPGVDNTSDILTKQLPQPAFSRHADTMLNDKSTSNYAAAAARGLEPE